MIAEARQRAEGFDLPVEFSVGDAHDLEFTDNTFDGCRADRVFQHLPDREGALAEMIRVARPGARIVVLDPDWGTAVVDSPDRELTRKVVGRMCDRRRNGWCGRQLHRFFKRAGLLDVFVYPWTLVITDLALTDQLGRLRTTVQELHEAGEVTAAEANGWLEHLQQASQAGLFFSALTGFAACGRKPWELTT
jgi:ubiquinone/menaquinone biosynthesis C-methylase UbiE